MSTRARDFLLWGNAQNTQTRTDFNKVKPGAFTSKAHNLKSLGHQDRLFYL